MLPGPELRDDHVVALGEGRAVVFDDVVPGDDVVALRAALRAHRDALTPAGIGLDGQLRPAIRGDETAWLSDVGPEDEVLVGLWDLFDGLRRRLNEAAWLGLRRFDVQLACYPGDGAAYARHCDAFRGDAARRCTAILYLNDGWAPEHGGALRVWEPDGTRDVAPRGGRVVCFLSDRLDHAVLPVTHERWAATAWFRSDDEPPRMDGLAQRLP